MITCPAHIVIATNPIMWSNPTVMDDLDDNPSVSCTPQSNTNFNVGVTVVTCTTTDHAENTNQCTFNVTLGEL